MTFVPALPLGGSAGWAFLKRTMAAQQAALAATPEIRRDEDYFRAKIGGVITAEALVADRRLLKVALGAFGLDSDINNRFFIRKVLEDGTLKPGALANRLADKQYLALSKAFGFGDFSVPRTQLSDFADTVLGAYKTRRFEVAVGAQDNSFRLALNAARELPKLASGSGGDAAKWFTVMGSGPLRQVFETALGLPPRFGALDLDRQLGVFRDRAAAAFGTSTVAQFADPDRMEALIRRYLARSEIGGVAGATGGPLAGASTALTLLQNAQASRAARVQLVG